MAINEDRTYVYPMNPGIRVHTLLGNTQGNPIAKDHVAGLQYPVMRNWKMMDVGGGPNGVPDGKADLVYLDTLNATAGTGTRIYTLLAEGNGTWDEKPPFNLANVNVPDKLYWKPTDVNGDGKGDLVHIARNQSQISVDTLFSNGDGTWGAVNWTSSAQSAPIITLAAPNTLNWLATDINGDGRADFVHVDQLQAGLRIHTLLSRGDGSWDVRWDDAWAGFSAPNQRHWMALDMNADGKGDLVLLVPLGSGIRIYSLVSTGNGKWARLPPQDVWQGVNPTTSDTNNWRPGDINGDGHTDLVHLRSWGEKVLIETLLSKGNGTWVEKGPDFRIWPGSMPRDTVFWKLADSDGDTRADFTRLDFENSALRISSLTSDAPLESLAQINSSLGSITSIEYRLAHADISSSSADAPNLPVGMHTNVVSRISTYDGRMVEGREIETYTFKRPRWSYQARTLLAWRSAEVNHGTVNGRPPFVSTTHYQAFDEGIVRPYRIERSTHRVVQLDETWSSSDFVYETLANGPPFRSLLSARFDLYCHESLFANTPCMSNRTNQTHDEFGNLALIIDYGSGRREQLRTLRRSFFPATGPYIVELPALENIFAGDTTGTMMRATAYTYDDNGSYAMPPTKGLLASVSALNMQTNLPHTTVFEYDRYGNVTKETDPNSHSTTTVYDTVYNVFPVSSCNELSQCVGMKWDYAKGVVETITDVNSKDTEFVPYDPLGRLRNIVFPDGGISTREYLDEGDPKRQRIREKFNDGSVDGLWTDTYLDGLGRSYRVVKKGDRRGTTFVRETTFVGASALVRSQSHWYRTGGGTTKPSYEYLSYDEAGRLLMQKHPDGSSRSWAYANDKDNSLVTSTDESGHKKVTYTDAYGRIAQVRESNLGAEYVTVYQHDVMNALTTITDHAGNVTTFTWDSLGRKVAEKSPDRGLWTYEYDDAGNPIQQTDTRGLKTAFTYDALNRLKTRQWGPPNGEKTTWYYDEPGHGAGIGRLTSVSDPTGNTCGPTGTTEQLSYDSMGRVSSRGKCILGKSYGTGFSYDALGRLKTLTYPDQEVVTYGYNSAGRLRSMSGYVNVIAYNAAGHITSVHLANGTRERYQYNDKREWLYATSVSKGNTVLHEAIYENQPDGLISRTRSTTDKMNLRFAYDELHRVTWVEDDYSQEIEYDAIGNITYNTRAGGSYIYPDSNPNGVGRECRARARMH